MIVTNGEKKLLLNRLNSDATNQNQRSKTSSMSDILAGMIYASKMKTLAIPSTPTNFVNC